MKIYKFYRVHSDEGLENSQDLDVRDKYPLYAFTNDKSVRKEFKEFRDMSKFVERKSTIDDSEYRDFENSHRSQLLQKRKLKTFNDYGEEPFITEAEVICTWSEMDYMSDSMDNILTEVNFSPNPFLFTEEYTEALRELEYINIWKIYRNPRIYSGCPGHIDLDDLDYSPPAIYPDELRVFLELFGELFKS